MAQIWETGKEQKKRKSTAETQLGKEALGEIRAMHEEPQITQMTQMGQTTEKKKRPGTARRGG